MKRPGNPTHGLKSTYNTYGCRCQACTVANTADHRRLKGKPAPAHGTSGYVNYGCRCDTCKLAGSAKNRRNRAARLARLAAS